MTGLSVADVVKRADTNGAVQVFTASGGLLYPYAADGTFKTGDSYIILHSVTAGGPVKRTIYFWQGKDSSIDEQGYSALLARDIDDTFGGSPVQVRIQQGEETPEFKQLFPKGVKVTSGGVDSTLHHVTSTPTEPCKLFIVKRPAADKPPQVTEVQPKGTSLVSNASYVLDDPASHTLYVWHGANTGMKEKTKVLEVSNTFRLNRGNLRFTVLDQDDTTSADAAAFYGALGVKDIKGVVAAIAPCEGAVPGDAAVSGGAPRGDATASEATVYSVTKSGVDAGALAPKRSALDHTGQCLLIAGGRAWLWVGSKGGAPYESAASSFARSKGVTAALEVVKDRLETGLFMTHFPDWGKDEYVAPEALIHAASLQAAGYSPSPKTPRGPAIDWTALANKMVFDSDAATKAVGADSKTPASVESPEGKVTVWIVRGHELVEVTGAELGHFFTGDAYVVLHEFKTPNGDERQVIYFWQGRHATNTEQGTAAILATEMHNVKYKGTSALARVAQQAEPPSLVALFHGKMVAHRGERPPGGLPTGGSAVSGPRLYQIHHNGSQAEHAVEVEPSASSLNSGDVFLLKDAGGSVCVWYGSGCDAEEKALGTTAAATLTNGSVTSVKEGAEPASFWQALGGKADYPRTYTRMDQRPAVLFTVIDAGRLGVGVECTTTLTHETVDPNNMYILEAGDMLCLWRGSTAAAFEEQHARKLVNAYADALKRKVNIVDVQDGAEPPFFTMHFHGWDSSQRANPADLVKLKVTE